MKKDFWETFCDFAFYIIKSMLILLPCFINKVIALELWICGSIIIGYTWTSMKYIHIKLNKILKEGNK